MTAQSAESQVSILEVCMVEEEDTFRTGTLKVICAQVGGIKV